MTLFELSIYFILTLLTLITILFIALLVVGMFYIYEVLKSKARNKKAFNKAHPVGFTFSTKLKQRFPYGKWKLLGKDQNDCFIYERLK